jgi:hypothetical protein
VIEVAEHQHFAGAMILNNSRDQAAKFFQCQFHISLPKTKSPPGDTRQRAD